MHTFTTFLVKITTQGCSSIEGRAGLAEWSCWGTPSRIAFRNKSQPHHWSPPRPTRGILLNKTTWTKLIAAWKQNQNRESPRKENWHRNERSKIFGGDRARRRTSSFTHNSWIWMPVSRWRSWITCKKLIILRWYLPKVHQVNNRQVIQKGEAVLWITTSKWS